MKKSRWEGGRGVHALLPEAEVLVVNDGSTDLTSEKARAEGATVLELPFNLGIGGAMQAGYQYACEKGLTLLFRLMQMVNMIRRRLPNSLKPWKRKRWM
jgi:glycosyltransferase involved in cell wall biosynthesis